MKSELHIGFNSPLNSKDTESTTYGCRANNPEICRFYMLDGTCAFVSDDQVCTYIENGNNRRPDIILFVNGLPLVLIELKSPSKDEVGAENAYNQIRNYMQDIPRDRKGEFEPQILKKNQTSISQDIEEKILSMYAKGMTAGDIEAHIQDIYGISVSDSTVSRITDKILPIVREWQQRPLEGIYAVVFLDAIHYHVRSEGQIVKKAVYIAIGIDLDGRKDVLGMWVGENESAKFWATVLNGLKNRGVEDIFIACTDNLTGSIPNSV